MKGVALSPPLDGPQPSAGRIFGLHFYGIDTELHFYGIDTELRFYGFNTDLRLQSHLHVWGFGTY